MPFKEEGNLVEGRVALSSRGNSDRGESCMIAVPSLLSVKLARQYPLVWRTLMVSRRTGTLSEAVRGFLEAEGYSVVIRPGDLLVGSRRTIGEVDEYIYVWVLSADPRTAAAREAELLTRFAAAGEVHPRAQRFLVADSLEGLSTDFRSGALRWHDVGVRTPIQFFDTNFKWEESRNTASAVRELGNRGNYRISRRVAQPYRSGDRRGSDLLDEVLARLHDPDGPTVHIIVGPAGVGKSHLFEALFSQLYDEFIRYKAQRRYPIARPFALLPEHLKTAEAPAVRSILRGFLSTEFTRPLSLRAFDWKLTHGLALWMLDGFDEIISRDPDFLEYLLDLLTMPASSSPKIVLCLRDSLLATNEDLRLFIEDSFQSIALYELDKWGPSSIRAFANLRLPKRSSEFINVLMAELFEEDKLSLETDELSLIGDAIDNIIARDYAKDLLDPAIISHETVLELFEAVAEDDLHHDFTGVPVDNVREFAQLLLPIDLEDDDRRVFVEQMTNLAMFTRSQDGHLQFSQEILEHYLIGKALARRFANGSSFIAGLNLHWFPREWVTGQVLTEGIVNDHLTEDIRAQVMQASNRPTAFRNLAQLLSNALSDTGERLAVDLNNRDLRGLRFQGLDLRGESLIGADLTDVAFVNCNLQEARFEDAIFNRTVFRSDDEQFLRGADFGQLSRFYSIFASDRELKEHRAAKRWLDARTGVARSMIAPCNAAKQLRHLFGKFVRPDGTARRVHLHERYALSGSRFSNAKKTLEAVTRHGYFSVDRLGRVVRPDGDRNTEMIRYVMRLDVSNGIRQVLSDTCGLQDCVHVPRQ